ncbi:MULTISPECIES: hypothetical protein [Acinetobacter]|uniref:hypothetical protein n=1 Tax=Acinetobacter TaxID=469 RepID=UPI001CE3F104|nr:hypothetical protein [Acinetobacter sp. Marseille-P8610]
MKRRVYEEKQYQESEFDWQNTNRQSSDEELANLIVAKLLGNESFKHLTSINKKEEKQIGRQNSKEQVNIDFSSRRVSFLDKVSDGQHLATLERKFKFVQNYLIGVEVANQELYEDFQKYGFPEKKRRIKEDQFDLAQTILDGYKIRLLNRIEKFMLVLALKPLPAFIEENIDEQRVLERVDSSITSIGKEFIYLLSKYETISRFDHEYLTVSVKIFVSFIINRLNPKSRNCEFYLTTDISKKSIFELNNLLFSLRKAFIQGRYDDISVGALKGLYANRAGTQFRDYGEFHKTLQNLEIKAEKMRLRLKPHKMKDVAVYRFQVEIFQNRISVRHDFFGVFLTSLIKKAKQPNGLVGLIDHIYLWKEMESSTLQLDIILFFDANILSVHKDESYLFASIKNNFEKLIEVLLDKKNSIQEESNARKHKFSVTQIPILFGFIPEKVLLLESRNPRWKEIEGRLIPYFLIMAGVYERGYTDKIANRIGGGRNIA